MRAFRNPFLSRYRLLNLLGELVRRLILRISFHPFFVGGEGCS